jgi:hypothetical protein
MPSNSSWSPFRLPKLEKQRPRSLDYAMVRLTTNIVEPPSDTKLLVQLLPGTIHTFTVVPSIEGHASLNCTPVLRITGLSICAATRHLPPRFYGLDRGITGTVILGNTANDKSVLPWGGPWRLARLQCDEGVTWFDFPKNLFILVLFRSLRNLGKYSKASYMYSFLVGHESILLRYCLV